MGPTEEAHITDLKLTKTQLYFMNPSFINEFSFFCIFLCYFSLITYFFITRIIIAFSFIFI